MTFRAPHLRRVVSRTFLGVVLGAVIALGVVVVAMGLYLRAHLRDQILSRDALLIDAVAELQRDAAGTVDEFDLLETALAAGDLRGVIGLVITEPDGAILAQVPGDLLVSGIPLADRERAQATGAFARYHAALPLAVLFSEVDLEAETTPVVEIVVPLDDHEQATRLFAQFWTDGSPVAEEFATLDRNLLLQGTIAWLAATLAVAAVFGLAFGRLRKSGEALEARTRELESMNRELELAARTAAVGSISAHLLHGLKSPLAGLRAYLRAHGDDEALETTQRMQQLVHETLRVLRDEGREGGRPVALGELVEELRAKLKPLLGSPDRRIENGGLPELVLPRRAANLLRLVLENLAVNALEATGAATAVTISGERDGGTLRITVRDRSGGIPESVRPRLFSPGASSKREGSGLGLAISRQLLASIQGGLVLAETNAAGTCFEVELPLSPESLVAMERKL